MTAPTPWYEVVTDLKLAGRAATGLGAHGRGSAPQAGRDARVADHAFRPGGHDPVGAAAGALGEEHRALVLERALGRLARREGRLPTSYPGTLTAGRELLDRALDGERNAQVRVLRIRIGLTPRAPERHSSRRSGP